MRHSVTVVVVLTIMLSAGVVHANFLDNLQQQVQEAAEEQLNEQIFGDYSSLINNAQGTAADALSDEKINNIKSKFDEARSKIEETAKQFNAENTDQYKDLMKRIDNAEKKFDVKVAEFRAFVASKQVNELLSTDNLQGQLDSITEEQLGQLEQQIQQAEQQIETVKGYSEISAEDQIASATQELDAAKELLEQRKQELAAEAGEAVENAGQDAQDAVDEATGNDQ